MLKFFNKFQREVALFVPPFKGNHLAGGHGGTEGGQSFIGGLGAAQGEPAQPLQGAEVFQTIIGDFGVVDVQPAQAGEAGQFLQPFVGDRRVGEVQLLQTA